MTCDCEKKEQDDNGDKPKDCPEGQKFDADAGKCVSKEFGHDKDKDKDKDKKKEQIDDPAMSTQGELPEGDPGDKAAEVDPSTCPEGHTWDATLNICVPTDRKDPGDGQTSGTDKTASVEARLVKLEQKTRLRKTEKKPTAQVNDRSYHEDVEYKSIDEVANEYVDALHKYGKYEFTIPLDVLRSVNVGPAKSSGRGIPVRECFRDHPISLTEAYTKPNKTLREAVSISGTHATQDLDTDVAIVPGGISFIPVFQFAKVKQIQQGFDRARFFKTTLPANGIQTVGATPTEATQTLTSVEVIPVLINGVYLVGNYDLIENSPFDLLQAIVEASAASYDDFVATDMLDVISAEGTLTPGLWIRADTGATITLSDAESVITFDETGIAFGREYLEDQGYLRGGVKPVLALHPQQWRELITSTNVTSLATRSVPDIWLKANLEELFGVQLVVTNAINAVDNQTTDAYNAIMFVPNHTYGIAVKRDVTVKFHDIGEDNQVRVNTSWRTKTGIIDTSSTVRITSSQ